MTTVGWILLSLLMLPIFLPVRLARRFRGIETISRAAARRPYLSAAMLTFGNFCLGLAIAHFSQPSNPTPPNGPNNLQNRAPAQVEMMWPFIPPFTMNSATCWPPTPMPMHGSPIRHIPCGNISRAYTFCSSPPTPRNIRPLKGSSWRSGQHSFRYAHCRRFG